MSKVVTQKCTHLEIYKEGTSFELFKNAALSETLDDLKLRINSVLLPEAAVCK